ncbi:hypothetical protein CfE428DRAFT_3968 [Chthoniobacter flavus Ellin428]|uniref:Uncharacterized protein n=1 Tax=Chthoniobacter flavus Ellin428 TaxID=497964 RepID=B4D4Y0_9BACT|nr:hypothetical protein [Chthoniobacter flavus]EDY18583.1 hypothetical protein CfE428DRAFT_3968 [Chthoniobacter flavus Ellin428]TCO90962.1 hypothetical protein EV701_109112 [Chthoniobacter flavus]
MNTPLRAALVCLAIISIAVAATPNTRTRLTAQRIADLTAPAEGPHPKGYKIEISGLGSSLLAAAKPEGEILSVRELHFPSEFKPPQAAANGAPGITPTTPTAFETVNTGWSVRLTAKPHGKVIAVYGIADYVEAELVAGGYGVVAGPIYTEKGEVITPNKLDQPKLQTTTTRFNIFAVAGESYEVTLYRGAKSEKHIVTVSAE